jgi:hypothetical protein
MFFSKNSKRRRMTLWIALALVGLALWVYKTAYGEMIPGWRSLLINFLYFSSLAGSLAVWSAILQASKGTWAGGLERFVLSSSSFAIPSLVTLIMLWIGYKAWAPWTGSESQGGWLTPHVVFARDCAALAAFWGASAWYIRQRLEGKGSMPGGILIAVFSIVFSLLGFDLVMALDPKWYSSLFGGYFFISSLYIGCAGWTLWASLQSNCEPPQLRDLANLTLAFALLTTSFLYAQVLVIWYENLPHETRFLIRRMHDPRWSRVSIMLLASVYLGPLLLFLSRRAKENRWYVGIVSLFLLIGMWVERWWLVAPTFLQPPTLGIPEASLAMSFIGIFAICIETGYGRTQDLRKPDSIE